MIYTVIFYSSIFLSLFFLTFSLIKKSWLLLLISVLLSLPFSIYLSFIPIFRFTIMVPFIYLLIFYFVKNKE